MTMPGVAMPWLVGYYGVFQAGHVVLNVVYLRTVIDIELPTSPSRSPFSTVSRAWHVAR